MSTILDYPRLVDRIKAILSEVKDFDSMPAAPEEDEQNDLMRYLNLTVSHIIFTISVGLKSYWSKGGIRFEENSSECITKLRAHSTEIGKGAFGTVYKVKHLSGDPCLKNVPKSVKYVAMKMETVNTSFDGYQTPERLKIVQKIMLRAGKLGIGPTLYDMFVTLDNSTGNIFIVKVMEVIEGVSWSKKIWKTDSEKKKAVHLLQKLIQTMNEGGIIHHDLHVGNVLVSKSGDISIIDFDRATLSAREENLRLYAFNDTIPAAWLPIGVLSRNTSKYVMDMLIQEGSIVLPFVKAVVQDQANSNDNQGPKNQKTRKNRSKNYIG